MSASFQAYQLFQTLGHNGLAISRPSTQASVLSYKRFTEDILKAMFAYTRPSKTQTTFSQFYVEWIESKLGFDDEILKTYFKSVLFILQTETGTEMSFIAPILTKNPSREYLELIWRLREVFIDSVRRDELHFASLEGYFTYVSGIDKFLEAVEDYKEIRKEEVLRAVENRLEKNDSTKDTIEVNKLIAIVCGLYSQLNCYALSKPREFIPDKRNVNAYVYKCYKEQSLGGNTEALAKTNVRGKDNDQLSAWTTSKTQLRVGRIESRSKSEHPKSIKTHNKRSFV